MPARTHAPRAGLIETDLGSELILLDPATERMYSLNATGRAVWRGLGRPAAEIAAGVAAAFGADPAAAARDVAALLDALAGAGLVCAEPA